MDSQYPISLKQLQIVIGAMLMGNVGFMLASCVVALGGMMQPMPDMGMILLMVLGATMVGGSVAAFVVCGNLARQAAKAWNERLDDDHGLERVFALYWTSALITAAILEGIGLFGSLTVFITGEWLALIGPILTIAVMIGVFPIDVRWGEFHARATGTR